MPPRTVLRSGVTPGLAVLVAALAVALIGGLLWQRANGRMRRVPGAPIVPDISDMPDHGGGALASDLLPEGVTLPAGGRVLSGAQLGHPLGERGTLVQFSSAFCAPCRATRRILADVAAMADGVAYIEIDAESRLDLVRELKVLRTPTVLVLAADGQIVRRASGQPRKPDVIAAIGAAAAVPVDTISINKIGKQDSDSSNHHA
jgi:thiol-disulfide isomerase/thioredoxin